MYEYGDDGDDNLGTLVRPKVVKSVQFCEATKLYHTKPYRDATSLTGRPTIGSYPKEVR